MAFNVNIALNDNDLIYQLNDYDIIAGFYGNTTRTLVAFTTLLNLTDEGIIPIWLDDLSNNSLSNIDILFIDVETLTQAVENASDFLEMLWYWGKGFCILGYIDESYIPYSNDTMYGNMLNSTYEENTYWSYSLAWCILNSSYTNIIRNCGGASDLDSSAMQEFSELLKNDVKEIKEIRNEVTEKGFQKARAESYIPVYTLHLCFKNRTMFQKWLETRDPKYIEEIHPVEIGYTYAWLFANCTDAWEDDGNKYYRWRVCWGFEHYICEVTTSSCRCKTIYLYPRPHNYFTSAEVHNPEPPISYDPITVITFHGDEKWFFHWETCAETVLENQDILSVTTVITEYAHLSVAITIIDEDYFTFWISPSSGPNVVFVHVLTVWVWSGYYWIPDPRPPPPSWIW